MVAGTRLPVIALDPVSGISNEAWPVRLPVIPPFAVIRPVNVDGGLTANSGVSLSIETPEELTRRYPLLLYCISAMAPDGAHIYTLPLLRCRNPEFPTVEEFCPAAPNQANIDPPTHVPSDACPNVGELVVETAWSIQFVVDIAVNVPEGAVVFPAAN